jgi:hypothetical protein
MLARTGNQSMITEQKFAALTVKLWRLHQRFDAQAAAQPEARDKTRAEILKVLLQLRPQAEKGK